MDACSTQSRFDDLACPLVACLHKMPNIFHDGRKARRLVFETLQTRTLTIGETGSPVQSLATHFSQDL